MIAAEVRRQSRARPVSGAPVRCPMWSWHGRPARPSRHERQSSAECEPVGSGDLGIWGALISHDRPAASLERRAPCPGSGGALSIPLEPRCAEVLGYLRRNRHRVRYADGRAPNLPIGSGAVEAACKTLAMQRLEHPRMHRRHPGGQAIPTLRALIQSGRFALPHRCDAARERCAVQAEVGGLKCQFQGYTLSFPPEGHHRVVWQENLRQRP